MCIWLVRRRNIRTIRFLKGPLCSFLPVASLDLNSHFVNKTTTVMKGEAQINLYTVDKSKVQNVVQTLDLSNTSLNLPANSRVTLTKSFTFTKPRKVLTLTSHMHKLGEKFVIKIVGGARNGEVVYTSTDWEHPDIITFKTPIRPAKRRGAHSLKSRIIIPPVKLLVLA